MLREAAVEFTAVAAQPIACVEQDEQEALGAVSAGESDVVACCRHKTDSDHDSALLFLPFAWDALVVVVHPDNPVDNVSTRDLRRVVTGGITDWEELGGFDESIRAHLEAPGEAGVARTARELLFADQRLAFVPSDLSVLGDTGVEAAVVADADGFGLGEISSARLHPVKLLAIDGVAPTAENVVSGTYPLVHPLFLVVRRDREAACRPFVDFLRGPGQRLVQRRGCVGLADGERLWPRYRERLLRLNTRIGR